jgi:hypothetical protein
MATILALRQRLIAESAITTAAETMLVDLAVLSYYHTLRVQGWIGHLAVRIEHEFFGDDAFTEMARQGFRRTDRFAVEERVRQPSKGSRVRLPTMQEFFDVPDFADREKMQ